MAGVIASKVRKQRSAVKTRPGETEQQLAAHYLNVGTSEQ